MRGSFLTLSRRNYATCLENYCIYFILIVDFKQHGEKAINKEIYGLPYSYYGVGKRLHFNNKNHLEQDYFNSRIKCDSEFAKTFAYQVIALCLNPSLRHAKNDLVLPEARIKAEFYSKTIKPGAYSCARGIEQIRKNIAKYYSKRDGFHISEDDIFLLYGGTDAYHHIIGTIFNKNDQVIIYFL
jgi:hypothetical protein